MFKKALVRKSRRYDQTTTYHSYLSRNHQWWVEEVERRQISKENNEQFWQEQRATNNRALFLNDVALGIEPINETVWWYAEDFYKLGYISHGQYEEIARLIKIFWRKEELREAKEKFIQSYEDWEDKNPPRKEYFPHAPSKTIKRRWKRKI